MRQEKQILRDEIRGQIDKFPSFVIMRHIGLSANTMSDFRRSIFKMGGNVEFVRKRVLVKAAEEAGVSLIWRCCQVISVCICKRRSVELTKYVFQFGKENDPAVEVIGGRFEGKLYNATQIEMLSALPSRDEMRSQFLATLEAPMAQTLSVMEAVLTSVVYCLDNKRKQMEG